MGTVLTDSLRAMSQSEPSPKTQDRPRRLIPLFSASSVHDRSCSEQEFCTAVKSCLSQAHKGQTAQGYELV